MVHRKTTTNNINRPTVINQQTTNITKNVTNNNVNQWFTNNNTVVQPAINSRHWNNRPWWHSPDYQDWHHGHWAGRHYFRGRDSWAHVDTANHEWLSGLAAWGLGNLIYRNGYQTYTNPYYSRPIILGSTTIDYSHPISVLKSPYEIAYVTDQIKAQQLHQQALANFEAARKAYYFGDPKRAFEYVSQAIELMPDDATMHEFRSLVLFSAGRYPEAAEGIHAVLAVAPGWDWTTLMGFYADQRAYVLQLRSLEEYVRTNPRRSDARFLLAYHYITMRHPDAAARQLESVLALNPVDHLSADLLNLVSDNAAETNDNTTPPAKGEIQLGELEGKWKAQRSQGQIELEIQDGKFDWDYDLVDNDNTLRGKVLVVDNLLIFATKEGSQMVGTVAVSGPDHFTFRLLGSDADDPGITFARQG